MRDECEKPAEIIIEYVLGGRVGQNDDINTEDTAANGHVLRLDYLRTDKVSCSWIRSNVPHNSIPARIFA